MAEEIDRYYYERTAAEHGFECVCGIDEAGRGPLAGPVFAAAVILPKDYIIEGLNDSKKLSEKKRDLLFDEIKEHAVYAVASASVEEIDEMNILNATFLAMRRGSARASAGGVCGRQPPAGSARAVKGYCKRRLTERVNSRSVDNGEGQQGQIYALSRRAVAGILLQKAQGLRHEAAL